MKNELLHTLKIFSAVFFCVVTFSCIEKKTITESGILLTFDDRNMLNWEKQLPLFEKYNAHVTFFVDHFDKLSSEQIQALDKLKAAGHTIGCHGLKHVKAAEFCKQHSSEEYIATEIEPALAAMKKQGFEPTCFGYPNSNRSNLTDSILARYFRHLRTGGAKLENIETILYNIDDLKETVCLKGLSFHPKSKDDELVLKVKNIIYQIKGKDKLLVLYAHDIRNNGEKGPRNYITIDALEELLKFAYDNQIKFYTYDELP